MHYFDDLNAEGAEDRAELHAALLDRWIEENPPGVGVGWEPYTVARRIVNWIKWCLLRSNIRPTWLHSLAVQSRWLYKRIEWHLLGNHLFADAKALIFSGLMFESRESDAWLRRGLAIISRELREQVLADGGHFERSPMYHALFMEDVLDLINADRTWPGLIPEAISYRLRSCAPWLTRWLEIMSHPDGHPTFFNDAAFGVAAELESLQDYARRLDVPNAVPWQRDELVHLRDSGYVRIETGNAVAFLDVAPVGPDYLPGHAHADTLSMELSLSGQRLIVNGGTSRYGSGPERARERGTSSHSTVQIDGQDSSEVWGGFRVARRAYPFGLIIQPEPDGVTVECAHDGYRRLQGRPVHRRSWRFESSSLIVRDEIEGAFAEAVARYHIHPNVGVIPMEGGYQLRLPAGDCAELSVLAGSATLAASCWRPRFGSSIPCVCLSVAADESRIELEFRW